MFCLLNFYYKEKYRVQFIDGDTEDCVVAHSLPSQKQTKSKSKHSLKQAVPMYHWSKSINNLINKTKHFPKLTL